MVSASLAVSEVNCSLAFAAFRMPPAFSTWKTPCGNIYDSGNYPAVLDRALQMADYAELRRMQAEARTQGRFIGIGLAVPITTAAGAAGLPPY